MDKDEAINKLFGNYKSCNNNNDNFDFGEFLNSFTKAQSTVPPSNEDNKDDGEIYDWKKAYEEVLSDFNAYRKRTEISRSVEKKNLTKEIIRGFIDIIDYILYTFNAKNHLGTYSKEDEMILNRLFSFLKKYDVHPMENVDGHPFDHNFHEAILVDRSGMFESGIVTMVINQGYMIGDEVLRHARVCVSGEPDA